MGLGDLNIRLNRNGCNPCVDLSNLYKEIKDLRTLIYNTPSSSGGCIPTVNGHHGCIIDLTTSDIPEGINFYYTNARVQSFSDPRYAFKIHKHYIEDIINFPNQTNENGKVLFTNGTTLYWGTITSAGIFQDTDTIDFTKNLDTVTASVIVNELNNTIDTVLVWDGNSIFQRDVSSLIPISSIKNDIFSAIQTTNAITGTYDSINDIYLLEWGGRLTKNTSVYSNFNDFYNVDFANLGQLTVDAKLVRLTANSNDIELYATTGLIRANSKLYLDNVAHDVSSPDILVWDSAGIVAYRTISEIIEAYGGVGVTSVGLVMPSAFTVSNSPVTSIGDLTVVGAGSSSQYIDGTGSLQTFPAIPTQYTDELAQDAIFNNIVFQNGLTGIYNDASNTYTGELGGSLIKSTIIAAQQNLFSIQNTSGLILEAIYNTGTITSQIFLGGLTGNTTLTSRNTTTNDSATGTYTPTGLTFSTSDTTATKSYLNITNSKITLNNVFSYYEISSLLSLSSQNSIVGYDSTTSRVGKISIGTGINLISGVLSINSSYVTSLINLSGSTPITYDSTTGTVGFDQTVSIDNNARVGVRKNNGGITSRRRRINFIEGSSNIVINVTDDPASEEVDVTIDTNIAVETKVEIRFHVGDSGYPTADTNTYGDARLVNKKIRVYRSGERLFEGDTVNGIDFDDTTGIITFYPNLNDVEPIIIEAESKDNWLIIEGTTPPTGGFPYDFPFDFGT